MATLNQIATAYCDSVNQHFNTILLERVKYHIKHLRAKFIRQDFEKNGISRNVVASYVDKLISVDRLDSCLIELGCTILRTEKKVPKTVQIKGALFQYVGGLDYMDMAWGEIDSSQVSTIQYSHWTANATRYYLLNDYIYIITKGKFKFIRIEAVYEDPEAVAAVCSSTDCLTDDDEFPISAHMIDLIYERLRAIGILGNTTDDKEIGNDD